MANGPTNLWDPLGLCADGDPLLKDPKVQKLINDIWDESTPFGISSLGWFGAHEHYGYVGNSNGATTTSGPFRATGKMGGYQSQHVNAVPTGTVAGVHSHWTNEKDASNDDYGVASKRQRPEYIVTKDDITRVNPDGTLNHFKRDGSSASKDCCKK